MKTRTMQVQIAGLTPAAATQIMQTRSNSKPALPRRQPMPVRHRIGRHT